MSKNTMSRNPIGIRTVEILHCAFGDDGTKVAEVDPGVGPDVESALERAWRLTNIDTPWWTNDGVTPCGRTVEKGGCRSTSVGDLARVVQEDGSSRMWLCASFGWKPLELAAMSA